MRNDCRFFSPDPPAVERVHHARGREVGQREVDEGTHDQLRQRTPTFRTSGLELHRIARTRFSIKSASHQVNSLKCFYLIQN